MPIKISNTLLRKKAAILTIDGVGEWTTTAYGIGNKNDIILTNARELHRIVFDSPSAYERKFIQFKPEYMSAFQSEGYNILNFPFRQKGLKAAHAKGLGIATMNPLSGGLIPQKADYFDYIRADEDKTVVDAALRFNASHDEITTVLAGMGSMEEVLQNCSIGDNLSKLDAKKLQEIEGKLFNSMDKLCTGCRYCEYCPKKIPVSKYMLSYNSHILGDTQGIFNNIKWHWGIKSETVKECIECGICEGKCTQHLPIISRLKEIDEFSKTMDR